MRYPCAVTVTFALCAFAPALAEAHCLAGARSFPATLAVEEPCVHEALALPDFVASSTGDLPADQGFDIGGHYSKRVFENLAIEVGRHWGWLGTPQGATFGPGAIETGVKYQFVTLPEQEFMASAMFSVEWGNTGALALGAPTYHIYTAGLAFGKGFGDLPFSLNLLRPFALTGDIGYSIPARASTMGPAFEVERNPQVLSTGLSLQYSMPYLRQHVVDLDLPRFVNRLVPLVELALETPVANTFTSGRATVGTVNPGVIYTDTAWQFGVEAMIPINRLSGRDVGVRAQLHLALDEILPPELSRPLFAGGPPMIGSGGAR